MRVSCKGISLAVLVLIYFVISIQSRKKPPKAKAKGRAAAVLKSDCGPTEAFHNESGKCYETGMPAPCPEMMKFYADPEAEGFGDCDCEESDCARNVHYVYWQQDNRCFRAYHEQGPCDDGEWLVLGSSGDGECQKNYCISDTEDFGEAIDKLNGTLKHYQKNEICTCIEMQDSNPISIHSNATTTEPTQMRIVKLDINCSCIAYQFDMLNSTANRLKFLQSPNSNIFSTSCSMLVGVVTLMKLLAC